MNSFRYQYLKLKLEKEFFEMLSKAVDQSQRIDQSGNESLILWKMEE